MKNLHNLLCLFLFLSINPIFSQTEEQALKAETGTLTFLGISQPISSLAEFSGIKDRDFERNEEMKDRNYPFAETALPKGPDPVIQKNMGITNVSKGLTINYDGMFGTSYPPDPNGDVGPNHYFQTTNINYQIFDKAGNSLYGPADIRNFWGTSENVSDPVVLYDDNADRWFVEIFTMSPVGSYNLMMAISTSSKPDSTYYLYTLAGLPNLPDFTKFGVWRDGYYMSANSGGWDVYAFDRSAMLAGNPTGYVRFDNAWRPNSGFHCIMPLDNDGTFAPVGTPGQFITINDDAWGGNDEIWLYELVVDWTNTSTATFTRTQQISVASFDSNFGPGMENIYQQGTSQRIDAVPQVLNYRAQYRNFGTHQTIVCNHSVDIDNTDHAGVRWYELRDTGGSWWLYQQSTYAPDAHSRWMGAISMNAYGDIGLAYSVSSSSLYPGLRYTGRHASDPLGTMTFAEQSIWDGVYSQTYGNRWGDYFSMSVDPSDNRTFWFTGEYHGTNRRTRIAAINFGVYCAASGGCDEYISNVQFGSINNSTACTNYGDYTAMTTDLPLNGSELLTVIGSQTYYVDSCIVWIDWNNDGFFDVPGEEIVMNGSPGPGPYTTTIIPPPGTSTGLRTMRIRLDYNTTPAPCGTATWGEVEDYTINVTPKVPAIWTGAVDENWHNANNWSTAYIPDATTDVIIPDVINKCEVYAGTAYCNNLTVDYGSGNELRIWNQTLIVSGDVEMFGQLLMDHADGIFEVEGNIDWYAGSSASMQAYAIIEVQGDWKIQLGANVMMNDGIVTFSGPGISNISNDDEDCYFNDLVVYKYTPDYASVGSIGGDSLNIHGDLLIQPGCKLYHDNSDTIFLQGDYINLGIYEAYDWPVHINRNMVFNGTSQMILEGAGADSQFGNVMIKSSVSTSISGDDITINGFLWLKSGVLISNDFTISVGRSWINEIGSGGFDEGNGRVAFIGRYNNYIYTDETFNILELNKNGWDNFVFMDSVTITCQQYDWTRGGVWVDDGGEFTANDLIDNGIYGNWSLSDSGSVINIYNYGSGQYVDLNGEIKITGGTMNVYGGDLISYWPYDDYAEIEMTDGTLDFHDQGIYITDFTAYTLTENISGGTIRTVGGFWGESSDFTPDYGTMEFYGGTDADIYTINGCNLNNVLINKSTKNGMDINQKVKQKTIPLFDKKIGKPIGNGTKSNTLSLFDFLDINGNLVIESGVLNTAGHNIQVEGDWLNFVGDAGFIESTGWVTFDDDDNVGSVIHTNETFNNLMLSSTASGVHGLTFLDGVEINVLNLLDLQLGSLQMGFASMLHVEDDLFIANQAGLNASDGDNLITVGGNWTNENNPNTVFEGFWPGGETVIFNGSTDQVVNAYASEHNFTNLVIDKSGGGFKPITNIQVLGNLHIQNGDWIDNITGLTHYFYGDFMIGSGGNYYPQGTTSFNGTSDQFYENEGGAALFGELSIDKSGTLYLNSDMVVFNNNITTIYEGDLNLNGHWFKSGGNIYITDGGNLLVNSGAFLSIITAVYVDNGGVFTALGEEGSNATIFKDVVGYYGFEVNPGGIISANHATFTQMSSDGIWVRDGAIVDPLNAFNNCTFGEGENGYLANRLKINNDQILNLDNVTFTDNPYVPYSYNVGKFWDMGELQFTNFNGNFSGPDYEDDQHDRIHWIPSEYRVEAKVFLEGPFIGNHMTPALNPVLPLNHPFNPPLPYFGNPMPDWYYLAGGSVGFIPDPGVVDWVLVQLRDAISPGAALPTTAIATTPAFVMEDGSIIAMDGSPQLIFEITPVNDLFLVIWHRNHLGVISANPLTESGGIYSYDFSSDPGQAYGGLSAQVLLSGSPVIYGMMSGDGDGNGDVGLPDKNNIWKIQAGEKGYLESDYNLNIDVNNQDKNDFWFKNDGKATYIPD